MGSANFGNLYPQTPLFRNGSSLCSFALDDIQNLLGGLGPNWGSMNMDEVLRNMWTAEESQAIAAAMNPVEGHNRGLSSQFSLHKQGSLCLPRTLSSKLIEDAWKTLLPQQGSTEAVLADVNNQRQISLEDFLAKAGLVKERPSCAEVTLEDFLLKAGITREMPPPNEVSSNLASGNQVPLNQVQPVPTIHTMVPTNQAYQAVPTSQFLVPSNQLHLSSSIQTSVPSNQVLRQVPPIPVHRQAAPIQSGAATGSLDLPNQLHVASSMTPSDQMQQQVLPIPVHQQATQIHSGPVHQQVPPKQAFMGFGGFPMPRNDKGLENKNVQAAPRGLNSFNPAVTNVISCPPSAGKTQHDALNSMFLPGQQGDWMNDPYGKSITHQNQILQRHTIAEAASALASVSNNRNGTCCESSPGRPSPLGGGLGAVLGKGGLGTSLGGNATSISFGGPCSPLSSEFDEGTPGTSNLPASLISEYGIGQTQKKKRSADPPVERVIERRQRRMIKNRESAARSRARKQAYTVELEAKVSQLKEENMELLRKQEEETASRKKQILAFMPSTPEISSKGRFLKRTHTGPWCSTYYRCGTTCGRAPLYSATLVARGFSVAGALHVIDVYNMWLACYLWWK